MKRPKGAAGRIDWFYARPGCESCEKVRDELARRGLDVREERSTRRPLADDEARTLLAGVDEVWISRGRNLMRQAPGTARVEDLKGPTGGFRAPMLRRDGNLLVGFGEATLREWLDDNF